MPERNYIVEALAKARTRQSWNDRLAHWERPASDSEEATIERAATMVRRVMAQNRWFTGEGIQIAAQGSYYNNTNVRREADIDLRAVHPVVYVEYSPIVIPEYAYAALGYRRIDRTYDQIASQMRAEIGSQVALQFGDTNVDRSGNKAIRLKGLTGSRAEVDIVPCFVLDHVIWDPIAGIYQAIKGVAILGRVGGFRLNYPDQHHENGKAKRARTQYRFKKNVRMLKHMRDELVESGVLEAGLVPSFLVECLVYGVEDEYFLVETDDRYDRLLRVVTRIHEHLNDSAWVNTATEFNGIKSLFGSHQAWTLDAATRFSAAAWLRLMA